MRSKEKQFHDLWVLRRGLSLVIICSDWSWVCYTDKTSCSYWYLLYYRIYRRTEDGFPRKPPPPHTHILIITKTLIAPAGTSGPSKHRSPNTQLIDWLSSLGLLDKHICALTFHLVNLCLLPSCIEWNRSGIYILTHQEILVHYLPNKCAW